MVSNFDIYIHNGTRTPILIGFEQLLDVSLKKRLSFLPTNFSSKAKAPPLQLIQQCEQYSVAQVN